MSKGPEKKGWLIAFEGIDAAGKKTWASFVAEFITQRGFQVDTFSYPDYRSPWGKIIKQYLNGELEMSPEEQFFTYFTDIYKDQVAVRDLLRKGYFVILDRYFASTVAFQCAKGFSYRRALAIIGAAGPLIPDVAFLFDVTPEVARKRSFRRSFLDRHERDMKLQSDVASFYQKLVREEKLARKWITVYGDRQIRSLMPFMEKSILKMIGE